MQFRENPHAELRVPRVYPEPVCDLSDALANGTSKPPLLGKEVMEQVWADMARTTLPSWMGRAPKNLGSPSHGKLKADQWRTACTVNLVITLVRLWGQHDSNEDLQAILSNFISLVIMVRWASRRSTSLDHIEIIQSNLDYYLKSLVDLFGKSVIRPNHHLSLHITECLQAFGPVHGWWAFPFERYNGILQRKNTNNKLGMFRLVLDVYFIDMLFNSN